MMRRFNRNYRKAFEQIRDPLLVVDDNGTIRGSNPSARAALDIGESGHIRDVVSLEKSFVFDSNLFMSLIRGSTPVLGRRLVDEEGNEANVVVDVLDLDGKRGKSGLKLIHIKDYSVHANYERWKDELISMVAHEIKNPLAAMKNSMDILISQASGPMNDGQRKLLTVSTRSIDRLTRFLDNVLDVSRMNTGRYVPEPHWVDAREFAGEVVDTFKTLFNVNRHELNISVSDEIDRIYVDAPKLEQILINVLNNAVKFTHGGGEVHMSVEPSSLEALSEKLRIVPWNDLSRLSFVRFVIKDTGIGMTEDTLAHLFTRHYGKTESGSVKGAHLGLSISKTLVEVQNGRISFDSELGVGTEVAVSIPADEKTFSLINRVRSIERVLDRLAGYRTGAMYYAFHKQDSRQWKDLTRTWPKRPVFNPTIEDEKRESFFVWDLNDHIALSLLLMVEEQPPAKTLFGQIRLRHDEYMEHADGFAIVERHLAPEDAQISKLVTLALKPIEHMSEVR